MRIPGILLFVAASGWCGAQSLWVEGEEANRRNVNPHGWYDSVLNDELSGGAWLSNFAKGEERVGTAEYDLAIPEDGKYSLWLRAIRSARRCR